MPANSNSPSDKSAVTVKPSIWSVLRNQRMIITLLFGFSSGLPLALTSSTFKIWLSREGIDVKTVGLLTWVGMAYTMKLLWAPLFDRYTLPKFGRRRGWLFVTQLGLALSIFGMGMLSPKSNLIGMIIMAITVAFFSACQDTVIDAYRRETLQEDELGLGATLYTYGYRIAMFVSGALGLYLVDPNTANLSWSEFYTAMALTVGVGVCTTILAPEPKVIVETNQDEKPSLYKAYWHPLVDFFSRPNALLILGFLLFFKFGDACAAALLPKYYVEMGYTNEEIGAIAKAFATGAAMLGLFLGGTMLLYLDLVKALFLTGILQGLSAASFALITWTGHAKWALATVIAFEEISWSMGGAALLAYLSRLTNRKFSATQYAALSSVTTIARNFVSGFSGYVQAEIGWRSFYLLCGLLALPGMFLLYLMRSRVYESFVNETSTIELQKN